MQENLQEDIVVKATLFSRLPKWLRIVLIIISIITIIYWIGWLLWKLNKLFRKFLEWLAQPRNYYWFEGILLFSILCGLVVAQFCSDFKPFTHLGRGIKDLINNIRELIANIIRG